MDRSNEFEIKRDVFRKWLEQFTADECVKLLGDVYDAVNYKNFVDANLRGVSCN